MYEDIMRFPHPYKENTPFYLQMCGVSYCDGSYRIIRPDSAIYCIEYVLSGTGTVQIDNTTFTASAGDIYILPAKHMHRYFSDAKNPWVKIWFNVNGALIDQLFSCYGIENTYHVQGLNIYPLFREFLDTAKAADTTWQAEKDCACILLKIVQAISEHLHASPQTTPTLARRLKDKIDTMTDFTVSFDALIRDLYCTKSHIIRLFRTQYGITPYAYLLNRRLSQARLLLENSALRIADISATLGFRDSHYFSSFFKRQTGMCPQEYRNRHRI